MQLKKNITIKHLKLIAYITMLIDHIGAILVEPSLNGFEDIEYIKNNSNIYSLYFILRFIGRLSFPIFCFNLIEGYKHTSNVKKYALRLLLLAILSEIPYDLAFHNKIVYLGDQNIIWSLLLGLVSMYISDKIFKNNIIGTIFTFTLSGVILFFAKVDYSFLGSIFIFFMYIFYNKNFYRNLSVAIATLIQFPAPLTTILMEKYNGEKGNQGKYFKLWNYFYPAHLLVLWLIYRIIYTNGF